MIFRDTRLTCEACGKPFFFTVTEQRQLAERSGAEEVEPPKLCPQCRPSTQGPVQPRAAMQAVSEAPVERPAEPQARTEPAVERPAKPPVRTEPAVRERVERAAESQVLDETLEDFPLEIEGIEIKLIGRVKWYSREKGYGFVTTANDQDIFFHRASIVDRNARLDEDDQVEFQIRQTNKGPEAFNVSLLPLE
ncbi:MAG: cold shock domain-containing protein [Anaerolineae bacterium]|nr:cold shock domain-containing protein [Anaerolineae bacterium]